ncbi:MAG: DUF2207 domain-containing protein [Minisyncoccia bacterium]
MNKKSIQRLFFSLILVLGVALFVGEQVSAQTFPSQEKINDFQTSIVVNSDSSLIVEENIVYDFGTLEKHGIYRTIPINYQTKLGNQSIGLKDISVTDEKDNAYNFTVSNSGNKEEIKIGNANFTITGVHVYKIKYKVERAIGYFDTFDEIYWNATGNEWNVPILKANATVLLPNTVALNEAKIACYYGYIGSNTKCDGQPEIDSTGQIQGVKFDLIKSLDANQGLTVSVGFPKNIVHTPTTLDNILSFVADNPVTFLPLIVFIIMFMLWWKNGRDPKGSGIIVAEYDSPEGLTPIEIAGILDTKIRNDKLSAEIIYLATKGYLKIKKIETKILIFNQTDYELTLLKDYTDVTNYSDKELLSAIFPLNMTAPTKKLSELRDHFYQSIPNITKATFEALTARSYYKKSPVEVGKPYKWILSFLILIIYLASGGIGASGIMSLISIVVSVIIILGFGKIMPAKTPKGAEMKDKILGLKEYLQIAEKDRINFHNAPDKNPALFEKLLPFAMVLGVEKAWAKEFEGIYMAEPSWYSDPHHNGMFNAMILTNSLNGFNSVASTALASAPGRSSGSGGGGFSGGGGGGGGGGSW